MTRATLTEILTTYKWIKVKRYYDDDNLSWEERYTALEAHHEKETEFLISQVRYYAEYVFGLVNSGE